MFGGKRLEILVRGDQDNWSRVIGGTMFCEDIVKGDLVEREEDQTVWEKELYEYLWKTHTGSTTM